MTVVRRPGSPHRGLMEITIRLDGKAPRALLWLVASLLLVSIVVRYDIFESASEMQVTPATEMPSAVTESLEAFKNPTSKTIGPDTPVIVSRASSNPVKVETTSTTGFDESQVKSFSTSSKVTEQTGMKSTPLRKKTKEVDGGDEGSSMSKLKQSSTSSKVKKSSLRSSSKYTPTSVKKATKTTTQAKESPVLKATSVKKATNVATQSTGTQALKTTTVKKTTTVTTQSVARKTDETNPALEKLEEEMDASLESGKADVGGDGEADAESATGKDPTVPETQDPNDQQTNFRAGVPLEDGTLPIRRFRITSGVELATNRDIRYDFDDNAVAWCNKICMANPKCDAWQLYPHVTVLPKKTKFKKLCTIYADGEGGEDRLDSSQAPGNDPRYIMGFRQRNVSVLRSRYDANKQEDRSERFLYILHSPIFNQELADQLINTILPSYLPYHTFDVVFISPEIVTVKMGTDPRPYTSMINPFKKSRGSNAHMSMPIVRSKFPGYKGYLMANDDAAVRLWQLAKDPELYLGNSPWGLFPMREVGKPMASAEQKPREIVTKYPYGDYPEKYAYWHVDSGSMVTVMPRNNTRSNFDAVLAATNDFCRDPELHLFPTDSIRRREFCKNRKETLMSPLVHGSSGVFYVPGTPLGERFSRTLALMGEHDVVTDIAVPVAYHLTVPDKKLLGFSKCDTRKASHTSSSDTIDTTCPVVQPVKFSKEENVEFWKARVKEECKTCSVKWGAKMKTGTSFWRTIQ